MCWFGFFFISSHTLYGYWREKAICSMCRRNKSAIPCHAKGKEFFSLDFFFIPSFSPGIIYASYPGKCFSIGWILNKQASQNFAPSYSLFSPVFCAYNTCKIQFFFSISTNFFAYFHVIIVISFPSSQTISNCLPLLVKYMICML